MRERELSHHAVWSVPGAVGEFVHFLTTLAFPVLGEPLEMAFYRSHLPLLLRHASHTAHTQQHM